MEGEPLNWKPIRLLSPRHGDPQRFKFRFPDGTTRCPPNWKDVVTEVVEWLMDNGHLKAADCPIMRPKARFRYLVNTTPKHRNGDDFSDCVRVGGCYPDVGLYIGFEVRPGLYVETKDNDDRLVDNARIIIKRVAPQLSNEFEFWDGPR